MAGRTVPLLHLDEHLLVADKPAGLLTVPAPNASGRTLLDLLRGMALAPLPVHRLDRETSGAIVFARTAEARSALEEAFRARAVRKTYWALALGRLRGARGVFRERIAVAGGRAAVSARGQEAETRWRALTAWPDCTEVEVDLQTGRTNQIRVHFAHAGHPLLGERKYARGKDAPPRLRAPRVALHAWRIAFRHPVTGREIACESPLPPDLAELRARAAGGGRAER